MNSIYYKIKYKIKNSDSRSLLILKNIFASSIFRVISIFVSLAIVPMTIDYLSQAIYGIWITLSSIIAWLHYFDLGFAHGFRNRFAEAIAKGDILLARKYVSTTYFILGTIFTILMVIVSLINKYINWSDILKVEQSLNNELKNVFQIMIIFFCIKIVVDIFNILVTAYQQPAIASAVSTGGSVLSLILIFIATRTTEGNLSLLALIFSGGPCILTFIVSIIFFRTKRFRNIAPNYKYIDLSLIKSIMGMGSQFFIIMIAMMLIFQFTSIIITRELGPENATLYNVTYKLFSITEMLLVIIMTPMWSAFTDAYTKKDFAWMKSTISKLEKIGLLYIPILVIVLILSEFIFDIWLRDTVKTNFALSAAMAIYIYTMIMGRIYMYPLNGIGKVRIQLITYIIIAIFSVPVIIFSCRIWGIVGATIVPTIAYTAQVIVCRIQLKKLLNEKATGIWNK